MTQNDGTGVLGLLCRVVGGAVVHADNPAETLPGARQVLTDDGTLVESRYQQHRVVDHTASLLEWGDPLALNSMGAQPVPRRTS